MAALAVGWLTRGAPAATPCAVPDVLFVCPAGTVKSAIAREMLKQEAVKRHIAVHVWSRGVAVVDHVSPELAANLKRDGIDPLAETPRELVPADLAHPDIVIAFDEAAHAPGLEHARNWAIRGFLADYDGAKADLGGPYRKPARRITTASLRCLTPTTRIPAVSRGTQRTHSTD